MNKLKENEEELKLKQTNKITLGYKVFWSAPRIHVSQLSHFLTESEEKAEVINREEERKIKQLQRNTANISGTCHCPSSNVHTFQYTGKLGINKRKAREEME